MDRLLEADMQDEVALERLSHSTFLLDRFRAPDIENSPVTTPVDAMSPLLEDDDEENVENSPISTPVDAMSPLPEDDDDDDDDEGIMNNGEDGVVGQEQFPVLVSRDRRNMRYRGLDGRWITSAVPQARLLPAAENEFAQQQPGMPFVDLQTLDDHMCLLPLD